MRRWRHTTMGQVGGHSKNPKSFQAALQPLGAGNHPPCAWRGFNDLKSSCDGPPQQWTHVTLATAVAGTCEP